MHSVVLIHSSFLAIVSAARGIIFTPLLGVVEEETSQLLCLCEHKEVELWVGVGGALVLHMSQKWREQY